MAEISREMFHAYLDDALSDEESARVESALRTVRRDSGRESARPFEREAS